ncbi:hypothetical protein KCH_22570 [Kitasatospora cheerisanensis KCTC 2395]|uniref:Uncharacterized protein n=1 Tax=Kitasatospora cheerisanensis KCTC 2395 TaxID=1348663 RepID=A0A066Z8D6_9ACTN|nr:hypothetical protein KCH_22570 [Kitasatospora cheerisanensis KCTC 2395]
MGAVRGLTGRRRPSAPAARPAARSAACCSVPAAGVRRPGGCRA